MISQDDIGKICDYIRTNEIQRAIFHCFKQEKESLLKVILFYIIS